MCVERTVIVNGLAAAIDPMSVEDSYSKSCYIVEDDVLEDGTVVTHLVESAPRSGYMLGMILNIQKVSNNIFHRSSGLCRGYRCPYQVLQCRN